MGRILYRIPKNRREKLEIVLMKEMVRNLCTGVKLEELYAAVNETGLEGIFCSTQMGGKKFWSFEELEKLFISKNGEEKRFRF